MIWAFTDLELATNFEDLRARLRDAGPPARGVEALRVLHPAAIANALRLDLSHRPEAEADLRDSLDDLVSFYSILEIAAIVGYIPAQLPAEVAAEFLFDLQFSALKSYYEDSCRLFLPELFRHRLEDGVGPRFGDGFILTFQSFLSLEGRARCDRAMRTFLRLLAGERSGEYGLEDVIRCLGDRRQYMDRLLRAPHEMDGLDFAVRGFGRLSAFLVDLHLFLERSSCPIVRSMIWHYFSYWFDVLSSEMAGTMYAGAEALASWQSTKSADERDSFERFRARTRSSLEELLSHDYRRAFRSWTDHGGSHF